jgi:hypothetical protein
VAILLSVEHLKLGTRNEVGQGTNYVRFFALEVRMGKKIFACACLVLFVEAF